MEGSKTLNYIKELLGNTPSDWLNLTTHRLDIYDEKLAKTEFLEQFESLFKENVSDSSSLNQLRTAYDYIRLGHPLSCVLEWTYAKLNNLEAKSVISFSSKTTPILSVLRKNLLENKATKIFYTEGVSPFLDVDAIKEIYGYQFELQSIGEGDAIPEFEGSTILLSSLSGIHHFNLSASIDFLVSVDDELGSILLVNGKANQDYISEIQHVRRRETIAMTPANCFILLNRLAGVEMKDETSTDVASIKSKVLSSIKQITQAPTKALLGSSGLSIQYAIMMGCVDDAVKNHPGKTISFVVPPNCYGGTNDQARRVAACIENVEVVDLPVDGDQDMVQSLEKVLSKIALKNAIPFIIAEIPTNPRVEVPELLQLKEVLSKARETADGAPAINSVFILDQTFCPNVHFLGEGKILSTIKAISYASGSKFPSGGLCTAGYCVGNAHATELMEKVEKHLQLCDNEATRLQVEILAKQLPSMNERIQDAYDNTRKFVNYIQATLPGAKINFVSEDLAMEGFTPSVFSLDLPTKGDTDEEREKYKRAENLRLINLMINEIPDESKFCVSYGQLKGCYWTIPATSTQGTTKEGDKDYIVRASLSANMDLALHKKVFKDFVEGIA